MLVTVSIDMLALPIKIQSKIVEDSERNCFLHAELGYRYSDCNENTIWSQFTCKRYFGEDVSTFSGTEILIRISVLISIQAKFDFWPSVYFTGRNFE